MKPKLIWFLWSLAWFFFSCRADQQPDFSKMDALIQDYQEQPSQALWDEIYTGFFKLLESGQQDASIGGEASHRFAQFLYNHGKAEEAKEVLTGALKNHYMGTATPENGLLLARILEEVDRKPTQASILRQGLYQYFPDNTAVADAYGKLGSLPPLKERIQEFGTRIFTDSTQEFNAVIAREFVQAAMHFALVCPKDSMAAVYLIDAATIARNLGNIPQVLEFFQWVHQGFAAHPKAADARFMEAFTYDVDLKNFDKAGEVYRDFLKDYPEHPFADDAQIMLKNLGKSEEEILKNLEKQ